MQSTFFLNRNLICFVGYIVDKTVRGISTVTAKKRRLPQKIDLDILRLAKQISNFMKRIE